MNLIALMAFYDEPPELLIGAIGSLEAAGVDHLVAVDGAYALYENGGPVSPANQHAAIVMTCRELGIACTLHAPSAVWAGNEPEKRTALFALGWALAEEGDWFLVHDADTLIAKAPPDLKHRLEQTDRQVATVDVLDTVAAKFNQPDWPTHFEYCGLFKAQPITVGPHHAQYRTAAGEYLWMGTGEHNPAPVLDLTEHVRVDHFPDKRAPDRLRKKLAYYQARDQTRVERGDCRCGAPAVAMIPTKWRMTRIGPVAEWVEACEPCYERLDKVSRRQLRQLGVSNPDDVAYENRNGRPPTGMTSRVA